VRRARAGCGHFALGLLCVALLAGPAFADGPPVEEDYVLNCSACHGPSGHGAGENVPSLYEVGEIALRPGGRDYLMRVPGAAQAPLDDARLARLLNWAVAEFGGVVLEPPLGEIEVGKARLRPLRDPGAARRALWPALPADG